MLPSLCFFYLLVSVAGSIDEDQVCQMSIRVKLTYCALRPPLGASTSMAITFSQLLALSPFHATRVEKIACYHCNEKMRQTKALYVKFNGQQRAVCCHGPLNLT